MFEARQKGFTLVELMVAMVVGTIIILGAGQLFLTNFQTFHQVDELSRKQESLVFMANALARDIRRANSESLNWKDVEGALELTVVATNKDSCPAGNSLKKEYSLGKDDNHEDYHLQLRQYCEGEDDKWSSNAPIIYGFHDSESLHFNGNILTFSLMSSDGGAESYAFHVQNRDEAINQ